MYDAVITFPALGEGFVFNPQRYIDLFGFKIYWYGLIIAVGFILAALYIGKRCRAYGLTGDDVMNMLLCSVPAGIVGARLYYIVFFLDNFKADTVGQFLKNCISLRNGGLAIYGGVIFGVIGLILYAHAKKIKTGAVLDLAAHGVIIGQIFGRWGNFINREAYGVSAGIDTFFLRMGLTTPDGVTTYVHPTFLYESVWNLIGFLILHFVSKKRKFDGQIFAMYVAWYGLGRFFIEGLRADSLYLFHTGLRVSQGLAALSFLAAAMYLILRLGDKAGLDPSRMYVNTEASRERMKKADKELRGEDISPEAPAENTEDKQTEQDQNDKEEQ